MRKYLFILAALLPLTLAAADLPDGSAGAKPEKEIFAASFARGRWSMRDFILVKSPRFPMNGAFEQRDDHIVNRVPAGKTPEELERSAAPYCALVLDRAISGGMTVSSRMSFDYRMAPLIVLAPELGRSADGRHLEFREHLELVLHDRGLNVWHHLYANGRPSWVKRAWLTANFAPKTVHDLSVTVENKDKGPRLIIRCGGHEFGCRLPDNFIDKPLYPGVIACEGVNRFYDFRVTRPE